MTIADSLFTIHSHISQRTPKKGAPRAFHAEE